MKPNLTLEITLENLLGPIAIMGSIGETKQLISSGIQLIELPHEAIKNPNSKAIVEHNLSDMIGYASYNNPFQPKESDLYLMYITDGVIDVYTFSPEIRIHEPHKKMAELIAKIEAGKLRVPDTSQKYQNSRIIRYHNVEPKTLEITHTVIENIITREREEVVYRKTNQMPNVGIDFDYTAFASNTAEQFTLEDYTRLLAQNNQPFVFHTQGKIGYIREQRAKNQQVITTSVSAYLGTQTEPEFQKWVDSQFLRIVQEDILDNPSARFKDEDNYLILIDSSGKHIYILDSQNGEEHNRIIQANIFVHHYQNESNRAIGTPPRDLAHALDEGVNIEDIVSNGRGGNSISSNVYMRRVYTSNSTNGIIYGQNTFVKTHKDPRRADIEFRVYEAMKRAGIPVADAKRIDDTTLEVTYVGLHPEFQDTNACLLAGNDNAKLTYFRDALDRTAQHLMVMNPPDGKGPISEEDIGYLREQKIASIARHFYPDETNSSAVPEEIKEKVLRVVRDEYDTFRALKALHYSASDPDFEEAREIYTRLISAKKEQYMQRFGAVLTDEFVRNIAVKFRLKEHYDPSKDFMIHDTEGRAIYRHGIENFEELSTVRFDFDNISMSLKFVELSFLLDAYGNDLTDEHRLELFNYGLNALGHDLTEEGRDVSIPLALSRLERNTLQTGHALDEKSPEESLHYFRIAEQILRLMANNTGYYWTTDEANTYQSKYDTTIKEDLSILHKSMVDHFGMAYQSIIAR